MKNKLKTWSILGALTLIIGGSMLHFTYEWSGYNPYVAMFSSVNESVWEHLKLGFGSLIAFSIIEYWFVRKEVRNYFVAKTVGLFVMELFIILFFYSYTIFTEEILIVDIFSYVVACILCQVMVYNTYRQAMFSSRAKITSILLLVLFTGVMVLFTFYPPKIGLFQEKHSGIYGTQWDYQL